MDRVQSLMKTRQDNDVTDYKEAVYAKNETKLSWSIRLSVDYDKNQRGQRRDWSYKCGLC